MIACVNINPYIFKLVDALAAPDSHGKYTCYLRCYIPLEFQRYTNVYDI